MKTKGWGCLLLVIGLLIVFFFFSQKDVATKPRKIRLREFNSMDTSQSAGVRITTDGDYEDVLPGTWFNEENSRYELRIKESIIELEKCRYSESFPTTNTDSGSIHTLIRQQVNLLVSVADLEEGKQVFSETFVGKSPMGCPEKHEFSFSTEYIKGEVDKSGIRNTLILKLKDAPSITNHSVGSLNFSFLVNYVAYSPDGESILTIGENPDDFGIQIWDVTTGMQSRYVLQGRGIRSATFSPNGKNILAIVSGDDYLHKLVVIVDLTTQKETLFLKDSSKMQTAIYSADSSKIAVQYEGVTKVFDATSGKELLNFSDEYHDLFAFSSDGSKIAVTDEGKDIPDIIIWNVNTGKELLRLTDNPTEFMGGITMSFSPDDHFLLMCGITNDERPDYYRDVANFQGSRMCLIWDIAIGKPTAYFGYNNGEVSDRSFSPDGKSFLTFHVNKAQIWDISELYKP
jgi:WD40 repeat protein